MATQSVEVPANTLEKLLSSLQSIEGKITHLETENAKLNDQVKTLQQHSRTTLRFIEPSFTLFPKLPLELRAKIWQIANAVPRIIAARTDYDRIPDEDDPDNGDFSEYYDLTLYQRTSPLMFACRESRTEAFKTLQSTVYGLMNHRCGVHTLFWNPKVDILLPYAEQCLCDDNSRQDNVIHVEPALGDHLDYTLECSAIAIPWQYLYSQWEFHGQNSRPTPNNLTALRNFMNVRVQVIYLVLGGKKLFREHDLTFVEPNGSLIETLGHGYQHVEWKCDVRLLEQRESVQLKDIDLPGKNSWFELEQVITSRYHRLVDDHNKEVMKAGVRLGLVGETLKSYLDAEGFRKRFHVPKFKFVVATTFSEQRRLGKL